MGWKRVCAVGDVAVGSLRKFDIDGVPILIANLGDEFRAYPPLCPHMEEPLEKSAVCNDGVLTCTKHLWQWDMRTGQVQGPAEKALLMYETRREGDDLLALIEHELEYEYAEDDDDDEFDW